IHVATPYGTSATLAVPVFKRALATNVPAFQAYSVDAKKKSITYQYQFQPEGDRYGILPGSVVRKEGAIRINWTRTAAGALNPIKVVLYFQIEPYPELAIELENTKFDDTTGQFAVDSDELGVKLASALASY